MSSNNEENLSGRYKKFIGTGFLRILLSRSISLLSVGIITRIIAPGIYGIVLALASGLIIIGHIVSFGLPWSMRQRALSEVFNLEETLSSGVNLTFSRSIPLGIILGIPYYFFTIRGIVLDITLIYFLVSITLYTLMNLLFTVHDLYLESHKVVMMQTIYSIATSFLIPYFFYLSPTLSNIILAWVISFLLAFVPYYYRLIEIVRVYFNFSSSKKIGKSLIKFALPVYLVGLPKIFAIEFETLLVFNRMSSELTSLFYFSNRLNIIALEAISVLLIGTFPLLTRKNAADKEATNKIFLSGTKMYLLLSFMGSMGIFINAPWIVPVLFGQNYSSIVLTVRILSFGIVFTSFTLFVFSLFNARAQRRKLIYCATVELISKISLEVAMLKYGINGIAIAAVVAKVILFIYVFYQADYLKLNIRSFYRVFSLILTSLLFILILDMIVTKTISGYLFANFSYIILSYMAYRLINPFDADDLNLMRRIIPKPLHFLF